MHKTTIYTALGALLLAGAAYPAHAADITYEPPVVYEEPPVQVVEKSYGGWYIRGDLDYSWMESRGVEFHTNPFGSNKFTSAESDNTYSIGAGVGYQIDKHFRVDLTGDYEFSTDFRGSTVGDCTIGGIEPGSCTSVDTASYSIFELMANAYVDVLHYQGFGAYVGAGIGGAYVSWDDLTNTATCASAGGNCNPFLPGYVGDGFGGSYTEIHEGEASWRFAYALMAGVTYDLTHDLKVDLGYRYKRVEGGKMFKYVGGHGTQGYDEGFNLHQVRLGLRYQFGNKEVAYTPPVYQEPVVYK